MPNWCEGKVYLYTKDGEKSERIKELIEEEINEDGCLFGEMFNFDSRIEPYITRQGVEIDGTFRWGPGYFNDYLTKFTIKNEIESTFIYAEKGCCYYGVIETVKKELPNMDKLLDLYLENNDILLVDIIKSYIPKYEVIEYGTSDSKEKDIFYGIVEESDYDEDESESGEEEEDVMGRVIDVLDLPIDYDGGWTRWGDVKRAYFWKMRYPDYYIDIWECWNSSG